MSTLNSVAQDFHRDGYAVVRDVLREEDFTDVRAEYAELLAARAQQWRAAGALTGGEDLAELPFDQHLVGLTALPGFDPGLLSELDITLPHMPFTSIRPNSKVHTGPAVLALLRHPRVLDVVSTLVGDEISASPNQHVRLKLPAPGGPGKFGARRGETLHAPTMWHQDAMTQIPQSDATTLVTCWIPLMDVDEEHGCLLVVPRRHEREQLLPWPMDADTVADLEANAVPLPVNRGDLVLIHKRTPHGSTVNRADRLRWSFDFRYHPSAEPSDRPWFPSVVAKSVKDPDLATTDAQRWRADWDRARDMFVESGQMVPGRREFAQLVAESLISRWESGDVPALSGSDGAGA
ncbi:phytanoyl-CoA dioxygenase family protein [Actinokineospora xionganensis]|uniref:Phytanoyl-CoA dioxygenase family protein n=1 Tax=Actinokineospora xionganensis TaxID=2684470 RepID=A0ABR7L409_9PSEU|nr:phytanoyl-CoA dioxygenase family protein [Actinokineospora xionganensis]MBC6447418.1 phytanoyl-CoA dioxygenase family protein [Actinokineospora xionganensis]